MVSVRCTAPTLAQADAIYRDIWEALEEAKDYDDPAMGPWGEDFMGEIRQEERLLQMDFRFSRIQRGLPALVQYLSAEGCTDIHYELTEQRFSDYLGSG